MRKPNKTTIKFKDIENKQTPFEENKELELHRVVNLWRIERFNWGGIYGDKI